MESLNEETNSQQSEEDFLKQRQEEYEKRLLELQCRNNWSRGKARRYLESVSRKVLKKFKKKALKSQKQYISPVAEQYE